MEVQSFDTREAILALCLILAGAEPLDEKSPCFNLYDEEILSKLGYGKTSGKEWTLREAAEEAWEQKEKGDVGYVLKMDARLLDLIRAYREQCKAIDAGHGKAFEMLSGIITQGGSGAIMQDEMILRMACVILKTRGEFMNLWKQMVPLLRVPVDGRVKHFETSAISKGKMVEAKGVQRPGFKIVSLNASEKTKEHLKL